MTIAELILELKQFPSDARLLIETTPDGELQDVKIRYYSAEETPRPFVVFFEKPYIPHITEYRHAGHN